MAPSGSGRYARRTIVVDVPLEFPPHLAEDFARGVEILTDRVAEVRPYRDRSGRRPHLLAVHIYGRVSQRTMDKVLRLRSDLQAQTRSRTPSRTR